MNHSKPLTLQAVSFFGLVLCSTVAFSQDAKQLAWLNKGVPDPAAIEAHDGSGFYIFATGKGIAVWHSADLISWKKIGRVFEDDVPPWSRRLIPKTDAVWAPDIHYAHGKYYLYYSVSTFGSQRSVIGLATNKTLDPKHKSYKWVDQGMVVESFPDKTDYNAIDPAMFVDDDGEGYLYWGSYWTGIKAAKLPQSKGQFNWSIPPNKAVSKRFDVAPTSVEAPYLTKHEGRYYLFVSWDFCCAQENSTYKIVVARSDKPLGPFVDRQGRKMSEGYGELVLMGDARWRGPGHNSVLRTKSRGDYLVYHVVDADNPNGGRVLQLRPLKWQDGWPTVGEPMATTAGRNAKPHPLVGRWSHTVNGNDHYDIFFEPNGAITGTKGEANWVLKGTQLEMRWKDPNAPKGFWIDRVQLSKDQHSYSGKNQNGTTIAGHKL